MEPKDDIAKEVDQENDMQELEDAWNLSEESNNEEEDTTPVAEGEAEAEAEPEPETAEREDGEPAPEAESEPSKEPEIAPPAGWKGVVKQKWKELPADVRQEIARRERDYAVGIQQYSETAKRASDYDRLLSPYQSLFVANGTNPVQGLQNILQTAASLQMGNNAGKAKIVGDLIQQYGVDIESLDNYLADGNVPESNQDQDRLEKLLEERMGPVNQLMQQLQGYQQQTQQQTFQKANQTVS
ncbi:MAG: hypothetical protein LC687_06035, partial [Actinobacteria bacterium]|nr:hypothetical protein [Actinomycetota bacterium]